MTNTVDSVPSVSSSLGLFNHFKLFKGCIPHILLGLFLNILPIT